MNSHENARLGLRGRERLVALLLTDGLPGSVVAAQCGVSTRTVWKWVRRYRDEGAAGLRDRSSRPQHSPRRLARHRRRQILRLRRQRRSAVEIATQLGLPCATVGVTLRRAGLGRLPPVTPPGPIRRYECGRPGELVHVDTKKLGRFRRPGHRVHGDPQRRSRGSGWEILHVAIDDATRLLYAEVLTDETADTVVGFLTRAQTWFAAQGIVVTAWMTDNGPAYLSRKVRQLWAAWQVQHRRTRPYRPQTNGKAERVIQTLLREWAYRRSYATSGWRQRALLGYLQYYNHTRRHTALGYQTPAARRVQLSEQRL